VALRRLNLAALEAKTISITHLFDPLVMPFPPPVGQLKVDQSPGLVVFRLNGNAIWTIDVQRFSGTPTLAVQATSPSGMRIELKNALYPGTKLPADFICVLSPSGIFGTPMELTFTLGGFHASVIAERWLAGTQPMQSAVKLNNPVTGLGASASLALAGDAEARFFPIWITAMASHAPLAKIAGLGLDMLSRTFILKLMLPGEPSLSAHPKARRTRMGLLAGAETWHLKPAVLNLPIGTLAAADGLFDSIEIEAGESLAGDMETVLAASSTQAAGLRLALAGGITDLDGKPGELLLASPRYAIAFDRNGDETALHARFGEARHWLAADGFAMQVGDPSGPPSFEVDTAGEHVTDVKCSPLLLMVAAPLAGDAAATKPLRLSAPALLPIVTASGATPGWGLIAGPTPVGMPQMSLADFSVAVIRRDDLLSLEFVFFNLALEGGGGTKPKLVQKAAADPARMVVWFNAPQNIAEEAFLETANDGKGNSLTGETPITPVKRLAAGPSRLAFELPGGTTSIAYTLEALLDWIKLTPSVAPVALPEPLQPVAALLPESSIGADAANPNAESVDTLDIFRTVDFGLGGIVFQPPPGLVPQIREPLPTETAIEAPWHLFLSPDANGAWKHATQAVTLGGRAELWHTRLAARAKGRDGLLIVDESLPRKIRAIWTTGYRPAPVPGHTPNPIPPDFRMSLDPNDRYQIVRQSADFTIKDHPPKPIDAEKLFLSSLGAWMDVHGAWDPVAISWGVSLSLEEWRHRAVMARDNYVRVVSAGYLLPHGHRASLVKVTERKLQSIQGGATTAYLRQRYFIIVREPTKSYDFLAANERRGLPYQKLTITTTVTPDLDAPQTDGGKYSFVPTVNGQPYLFHLIGQDAEQQTTQTSDFTSPLYFVEYSSETIYNNAVTNYKGVTWRTRPLNGQKVAFARSAKAGDTSFQTVDITFGGVLHAHDPAPPVFFAKMDGANVQVPAVQQVTGNPGPMEIRFYQKYLDNDFGAGGVFVENAAAALNVAFKGNQSGGVATPNLNVTGLSRQFGTVSGTLDTIAGGDFQPADYLSDAGAKLFGVIPLAGLIQAVFGDSTVPALKTNRLPTRIQTVLHWAPHVKDYSLGPLTLAFTGDPTTSLTIDTIIEAAFAGGAAPQASVEGHMRNFNLKLADVIALKFESFDFTAPAGKKPDVNVALAADPIEFLGDLSFLNELRKIIPDDGFKDPPFINVTTDGITAGYTLAVPTVAVGVFSIQNIKLSAALTLPFISGPLRFRFAFSEREDPFLTTVSLLGGGGFFGIAIGPDGVEILEASLEVGASVAIDVAVASGSVHIMVGVYLKIDFTSNESQLTGYLRAGGSLSVLGLISASVEFYLGFTYYFGPPCKIAGEATVTIEVHVLFFSAAVHATLRREFADPTISVKDLLGPSDWKTYCEAFAA
jgi:hypothetical protein